MQKKGTESSPKYSISKTFMIKMLTISRPKGTKMAGKSMSVSVTISSRRQRSVLMKAVTKTTPVRGR